MLALSEERACARTRRGPLPALREGGKRPRLGSRRISARPSFEPASNLVVDGRVVEKLEVVDAAEVASVLDLEWDPTPPAVPHTFVDTARIGSMISGWRAS